MSSILYRIKIRIYSAWISKEFASFGKATIIYPTLRSLIGAHSIFLGDQIVIGKNVTLTAWHKFQDQCFNPKIYIGNNTSIGDDSHITAINEIRIGENVLFGKKILITDNAHGVSSLNLLSISPSKRSLYSKGKVIIEDNVWIGEKASIMAGVHIGFGSIIAANSVVTKDVPPYCLVAGVPAVIVKDMRDDIKYPVPTDL